MRCNVFRVRNFADLGIKAAPPSFVDSKIKVAGQDELEMKASRATYPVSLFQRLRRDCQRFLQKS